MSYAFIHLLAKISAIILMPILIKIFGIIGFCCDWKYRNPADRTCKRCGRHQNQFEYWGDSTCTKWEDMGRETKNCNIFYKTP